VLQLTAIKANIEINKFRYIFTLVQNKYLGGMFLMQKALHTV